VELVSPADFEKAARMWDTLKLPIRLRQFKSGLLVVQGRDRTDEKTIASLLTWLKSLHGQMPSLDLTWDLQLYGRGVTAQETAERFGWSVGVAIEELEMASRVWTALDSGRTGSSRCLRPSSLFSANRTIPRIHATFHHQHVLPLDRVGGGGSHCGTPLLTNRLSICLFGVFEYASESIESPAFLMR
jgi:hypothetical protein